MQNLIWRPLLAVLFLCSAHGHSWAEEREQPPEGSAPKPFHSPKREEFTLSNGLRVTMVRYGLIPKVDVEIVVTGGDVAEPQDKQGVGSLVGELMKEGTTSRSAEQIAKETASVGGAISVRVESDQILLTGRALSDGAGKMVDLLADLAVHPRFPDSELPRLRKDQLRTVAILKSRPQTMAAQQFLRIIYGNNGYGREIPDEAGLKSVTMTDIKAYYAKTFVPSNARLYVAGVFDDHLRQTVEEAFASWPSGSPFSLPPIEARTKHTVSVVDRAGAPQSTIYMGLPVITPRNADYIPLEVTDSILGGSFMSRITSNIREQKGYTYSPYSSIESNAQDSVWIQQADVTTKFTGASLTEIFGEIDRLRKEPPPAKELQGIQNGLAGIFTLRNSSRRAIINMLNFVDVHKLPSNYLDTYVSNMYAVKPSDVQGMMEKYLDPKKMTIVVVGDRKQIDSQIAPFKTGE
jgi:predicted Zn-dependent peptidase